jgi:UDP-2,3-diacylglucosamine hydrolase
MVVRIADPAAALCAADMHLDDTDPELAACFFSALEAGLTQVLAQAATGQAAPARRATYPPAPPLAGATDAGDHAATLFLLGDLFEYWIGDDYLSEAAHGLSLRLARFTASGGRVFLMHGNRDFLMDVPVPGRADLTRFSARCGATLLPDPCIVEVGGRRVGLSHGDALCTDDTRYQQWRALCRSDAWQQEFLARPVAERLALAQSLRQQSIQAQAVTETLSDVNQAAVDDLMTRLDTSLLIHGHTHQPKLHQWQWQDKAAGGIVTRRSRRVLSDWAAAPPRGSLLPLSEAATPPAC